MIACRQKATFNFTKSKQLIYDRFSLVESESWRISSQVTMKSKLGFNRFFSFSSLLLGGFLVVLFPLLGGLFNISYQLDRIAADGRHSVKITEEVTLLSQQMAEAVLSLQRASGQYYVLEDPALLGRLEKSHFHILNTITSLRKMTLDEKQIAMLNDITIQESSLFKQLKSERRTSAEGFDSFKPDFDRLHNSVSAMTDQLGTLIQQQQAKVSQMAEQVQRTMIWQSAAFIVLSLLLAALLSWLLSRPVRQLSYSIRRLGDDDLKTRVSVKGPKDMVSLGNQLDWLRQRLIELEDEKQRFFRQVSHELKTPLAALWEAVDLLSNEVEGDLTHQQREILGIMQGSVGVLRQRIEELLNYQHALHQTKDRPRATVSLQSLIDGVSRSLDLSLKAKQLQLSTSLADVTLQVDETQMETVINNLVSNAIRYSPEGGRIDILAERLKDETQITICDQGPGIPADDRAYIFEPFYQGKNQIPGLIQGSGLGLAIARAHIETHGGKLTLIEEISTGTCFQISLPIDIEIADDEC
jgi:two-component system sensor histidine kinase GlrK